MQSKPESASGLRILVIEDEALIAEELQERLTHLGFRVIGVHDTAEQALYAAEVLRPDLILMDIRLKGGIDGIEAAKFIYRQFQIPVVYLTAYSDQLTRQRAMATSPFGYVLKPFQEQDLLVAIELATHRHALEQRVKASERKYATTLTAIADGVIATDSDGRVAFMNPVAEVLTGWRFTDAQGLMIEQVFRIVHEVSHQPMVNPIREALTLQSAVRHREPFLLMDRGGSAVLLEDSASVILDAEGKTCGTVLAFRDIRQRRLTEEALRKAEEQLRQAQKMEAIGQLAGGVAHNFNNLLAVIDGYCQLLLISGHLHNTAKAHIAEVHKAVVRAVSLIRQLLTFSRRQPLEPRVLDLNTLVSNTAEMLRHVIGEDIQVTTVLSPDLARVRVDPGQIEQVILNLATNARDAMPQGGQLTLATQNVEVGETITSARSEMIAGHYARLTVNDTGIGIDEATKTRLFEPFFTTKEMGTGLGLSSVYGIIQESGGYLFVDSEPGCGATFHIYFPAVRQATLPTQELPDSDAPLHGSATILLVEDEASLRSLLTMVLQKFGYTVLAAQDSTEAIQVSAQHAGPIHLLVTDVVLPDLSGRQLAEQLASVRPAMPVLYMSGYTDDAIVRYGVLAGKTAFLQKPFTTMALARKVRDILDPMK